MMLRRTFMKLAAVAILHPALRWVGVDQGKRWEGPREMPRQETWIVDGAGRKIMLWSEGVERYIGTFRGIPLHGFDSLS